MLDSLLDQVDWLEVAIKVAKNRAPSFYRNTIEQILLAHIYKLVKAEGEGNDAGGFESGNDEKDYIHVYEDDEDEKDYIHVYEDDEDEKDYIHVYEDDEDEDKIVLNLRGRVKTKMEITMKMAMAMTMKKWKKTRTKMITKTTKWMRMSLIRTANATVYKVSEWKQ